MTPPNRAQQIVLDAIHADGRWVTLLELRDALRLPKITDALLAALGYLLSMGLVTATTLPSGRIAYRRVQP